MSVSTTISGIFPNEVAAEIAIILDSISDGVYGVDLSGRIALVNRAAAAMLGWESQDLVGRNAHEAIHHSREDGSPFPAADCGLVTAVVSGHDVPPTEDVFWRHDGGSFPVEYESRALQRGAERVGSIVTFRDVSARKNAELRAREILRDQFALARAEYQHAQLRDVLAQTPAAICVTRGSRHVIDTLNEQYRELIGGDDLVGKTVRDAFPELADELLVLMDRAYETGTAQRVYERPLPRARHGVTGERFFNLVYQPLRAESGAVYGLMTHAVDVTEEVQARRNLERQNRIAELTADIGFSLTQSTSLEQILGTCVRAVVTHLDASVARIWTLNADEQVLELAASAGVASDLDPQYLRVPVGTSKIGLIAGQRLPHLTNDVLGDPLVVDKDWVRRQDLRSFAGYPLMVGDDTVGVLAMFARHELRATDLQALATVAHGIALGIQRKRAEDALRTRAEDLGRLAEALERSNTQLDAFAYAASHDLRAPLRGIANLAQWIEEDLAASGDLRPEMREMLELMRSRMHRMEALIEGILQYSRAGRVHQPPERLEMRRVLQDVVELMSVPPEARVEIGDLPTIHGPLLPLQQIFMNLIGNALKHANRPDPIVRVECRDAGAFVEFTVTDNGPGIAPEFHERIWGIFQTLAARDKVEGTGIGLSLVKKLVENHGGKVWVNSAPGEGSTFGFRWPKVVR
jgi:PAS domain S-box-containing protein